MLSAAKKEFIEFMMSADVLRFGSFVTKSGRQTVSYTHLDVYKRQGQRLGLIVHTQRFTDGDVFNAREADDLACLDFFDRGTHQTFDGVERYDLGAVRLDIQMCIRDSTGTAGGYQVPKPVKNGLMLNMGGSATSNYTFILGME